MFFSIIVPLYNCENFLNCLIETLDAQTCRDFEVIFIDDKSTDSTLKSLRKLTVPTNFTYKIIESTTNKGAGLSRNLGLGKVEGKYIIFLDSDDLLDKNTVQILKNVICANDMPDAILFDYYTIFNRKKIKCSTIPQFNEGFVSTDDAIVYSTGATCCKVYKTNIIRKNNIVFPNMRTKEDFIFNKTALSYCEKIYYKKSLLYNYIIRSNSVTNISNTGAPNSHIAEARAKTAFEIIEKNASGKHIEAIYNLKIKEFLFGTVQSMLRLNDCTKNIIEFIDRFTAYFPNWYEKKNKFSLYTKVFLYFINKKNIFALKIIIHTKDNLKRILSH